MNTLQKKYLLVYCFMIAGDYFQGAYTYALYDFYGYSQQEIAFLFIIGFLSSAITGPVVGRIADKYGRRRMVEYYAIMYIISCFTKHFNNYHFLIIGRILGGIATSLLMTVLDTWLVTETNGDAELLMDTFKKQVYFNSAVAVWSGIISGVFVLGNSYNRGIFHYGMYTIPFDLAIVSLVIGIYCVRRYWGENYGKLIETEKLKMTIEMILLGIVQSLFEASMYCFIFSWTPAIGSEFNHGIVFSILMAATAIGAYLKLSLTLVFFIGSLSLFMGPVLTIYGYYKGWYLICFIIFEICVGSYFPMMGTFKSKIVPDNHRATIYNIFRIPMNLIVAIVLLGQPSVDNVLLLSSLMLFMSLVIYKLTWS